MPDGVVHTVHRDGRWLNEVEGQAQPIDDAFERKEDGVLAGREIARDLGVNHRIHHLEGWVHERSATETGVRGETDLRGVSG